MTYLRASSLPAWTDCPRRAAATLLHDELLASGYKLREYTRASIGPAVGTAVDAGANEYLRAKLDGCEVTPSQALEIAIAAFRKEIANGCDFDATTPNPNDGEKQIARMLEVFRRDVLPDIKPQSVQLELTGNIGDGWVLGGHWDSRDTQRLLHDLKTGTDTWPVTPQKGAYILLGAANGLPIDAAVINYIERVPLKKQQPAASKIYYEADLLRRHALAVIRRVKRDVMAFRTTGDPETLPANPFSMFCSNRNCPAHDVRGDGKPFCDWWKK